MPIEHLHMVFIAALFMIVQTWKQPRCPLVGQWINKLVCPDKMILYDAKKKRPELPSHQGTLRSLNAHYKVKKANLKRHVTICDSYCVPFWGEETQNF